MVKNHKIGLSLSGGGYRATIYHLGTFRKLKQLGLLDKVDVISTVSGGSITGAYYGLKGENYLEFDQGIVEIVKKSIISGIFRSSRFILIIISVLAVLGTALYLSFTKYAWASIPLLLITIFIILRYQYKIFPVSDIINKLYSKWFFEDKTLKDFNRHPIIAINATNVETGRPFTFSKNKMSDSSYEYPTNGDAPITFIPDAFPISLAVAASACVPFAFTPIYIERKYYKDESNIDKIKPCLVDGGVYDNQGVHKLSHGKSSYVCDIIIVSDAGNMIQRINSFNNVVQLLIRTSDIFMNRIKNYQMIQYVYDNHKFNKKQIAYQSLGWDFDSCIEGFMDNLKKGAILDEVIDAHEISRIEIKNEEWKIIQEKLEDKIDYNKIKAKQPTPEELKIARSVKTNLKTLTDSQINALIKQAECLTEIQVKLYCTILN